VLFVTRTRLYVSHRPLKNGVYPNYGIKLVPTNNNHSNGSIASSDNSDSSIRPKLVIVYQSLGTTPTPTPTPTSAPSDTTAPSGSITINSGNEYANSTSVTISLSATDATGVTGYYVSTSSTTPSSSDSGWTSVTSTTSYSASISYTLSSGDGSKTIYVWYKDAAGAPTQANFSLSSLILPSPTPVVSDLCEVYGFVTDEDNHDLTEVNIAMEGEKKIKTKTDEDGYFEFTGLEAGKYTVTYEKEGYRKQSGDITLVEGEIRDLGIIVMEQNIAGSIYGTVTDAENEPVESAKVKLKGKGSNAKVKEKYTTEEDGSYEFTDLEEGTYIIQAKKKGYKKAKERIKLSDGEDNEVDLVLEKK